jgi:ferredoxin-thioredoxin reductase catalytic subunit
MIFDENLERIKKIAVARKLVLNPDEEKIQKVIGQMTENYNRYGYNFCPFKQQNKIPLKGEDVICPCSELDEEIEETGECSCQLFCK